MATADLLLEVFVGVARCVSLQGAELKKITLLSRKILDSF